MGLVSRDENVVVDPKPVEKMGGRGTALYDEERRYPFSAHLEFFPCFYLFSMAFGCRVHT
jgi:hypothetical protein